jgi:dolichol-phosphate mannosyltransferase
MSRQVVEAIRTMPETNRYLRGMVAWTGFRYSFVDFDRPERIHGETAYTWRKMFKLAFDGIWSFSQIPLKLGVPLAAMSVFFGSLAMLYMLYDLLVRGTEYQLYKWVVIIITMMIGLLYVQMWIIGEYVGRIYDQSRGRPMYIVRRTSNLR